MCARVASGISSRTRCPGKIRVGAAEPFTAVIRALGYRRGFGDGPEASRSTADLGPRAAAGGISDRTAVVLLAAVEGAAQPVEQR